MSGRQRRLGRVAAAACVGAATMTITMAVPAAAASGSADCPGIDVQDPLGSVKCPVDGVTQRILPSQPATSVPTTSPVPDRTTAPTATKRSGGDRSAPTRSSRRPAPAVGKAKGGAGNGGSAIGFSPPMPATVRLPQVDPAYPYPQVAGDPAYDGVPGRARPSVRAAAAEREDARILWARVATALVIALCGLHLGVASRRLRQETDRRLG